jgi:hypothetical protein
MKLTLSPGPEMQTIPIVWVHHAWRAEVGEHVVASDRGSMSRRGSESWTRGPQFERRGGREALRAARPRAARPARFILLPGSHGLADRTAYRWPRNIN